MNRWQLERDSLLRRWYSRISRPDRIYGRAWPDPIKRSDYLEVPKPAYLPASVHVHCFVWRGRLSTAGTATSCSKASPYSPTARHISKPAALSTTPSICTTSAAGHTASSPLTCMPESRCRPRTRPRHLSIIPRCCLRNPVQLRPQP